MGRKLQGIGDLRARFITFFAQAKRARLRRAEQDGARAQPRRHAFVEHAALVFLLLQLVQFLLVHIADTGLRPDLVHLHVRVDQSQDQVFSRAAPGDVLVSLPDRRIVERSILAGDLRVPGHDQFAARQHRQDRVHGYLIVDKGDGLQLRYVTDVPEAQVAHIVRQRDAGERLAGAAGRVVGVEIKNDGAEAAFLPLERGFDCALDLTDGTIRDRVGHGDELSVVLLVLRILAVRRPGENQRQKESEQGHGPVAVAEPCGARTLPCDYDHACTSAPGTPLSPRPVRPSRGANAANGGTRHAEPARAVATTVAGGAASVHFIIKVPEMRVKAFKSRPKQRLTGYLVADRLRPAPLAY